MVCSSRVLASISPEQCVDRRLRSACYLWRCTHCLPHCQSSGEWSAGATWLQSGIGYVLPCSYVVLSVTRTLPMSRSLSVNMRYTNFLFIIIMSGSGHVTKQNTRQSPKSRLSKKKAHLSCLLQTVCMRETWRQWRSTTAVAEAASRRAFLPCVPPGGWPRSDRRGMWGKIGGTHSHLQSTVASHEFWYKHFDLLLMNSYR